VTHGAKELVRQEAGAVKAFAQKTKFFLPDGTLN
jgi:hypothetical protein